MDETKYLKIDGREALRRLADGETVYGRDSGAWLMEGDKTIIYKSRLGVTNAIVKLNDFVQNKHLHIKKPFDVRQAMWDKPDEWVGFYKDDDGISWKVGFEVDSFQAVAIPYGINTKLPLYKKYRELGNWSTVTKEELEKCIPIEDGPEESKIYGMKPSVAICDEEATR